MAKQTKIMSQNVTHSCKLCTLIFDNSDILQLHNSLFHDNLKIKKDDHSENDKNVENLWDFHHHDEIDLKSEEIDSKCQEIEAKCEEIDVKPEVIDTKCQEIEVKCEEIDVKPEEIDTKWQEIEVKCEEVESEQLQNENNQEILLNQDPKSIEKEESIPDFETYDTKIGFESEEKDGTFNESGSRISKYSKISQIHATNHFQCQFCPKIFTSAQGKDYHERNHLGEKPFKCQFCPKKFAAKTAQKSHERQHNGEKPFQCQFCSKSFRHSNSKVYHERKYHTKEKPFKCKFCPKTFAISSERNSHQRNHIQEKLFECQFCSKKFTHSSGKSYHEKVCLEFSE